MNSIIEKLNTDHLIGFIKFKEIYTPYLMPVVYWILNQEKYDPGYEDNGTGYIFRNNVLNVKEDQVKDFINAIDEDKITLDELKMALSTDLPIEFRNVCFFIDFDKKVLVSSFPYIEIERYLPDRNWKGAFDNPINYLPTELKNKLV